MSQFVSDLRGATIVDERNYRQLLRGQHADRRRFGRGYVERDWRAQPFGSAPGSVDPPVPKIPRSEWADRIEERERKRALLSTRMDRKGIPILYQKRTNYCWMFGVVDAVHALRCRNGLEFVHLSPASVAAKQKNYRNVGGWGIEAIQAINKFGGLCPAEVWPATAIDRRYDTAESRAARKYFTIPEFYELPPHDFAAVMSCLIAGWPVPAGLLWWGHLVNFVDPLVLGRDEFGVRYRNSWSDRWGDKGYGVLAESKATPDEATAPRTVPAHRVAA